MSEEPWIPNKAAIKAINLMIAPDLVCHECGMKLGVDGACHYPECSNPEPPSTQAGEHSPTQEALEFLKANLKHPLWQEVAIKEIVSLRAQLHAAQTEAEGVKCPCTKADQPCHPRCSCIHGQSSHGCTCCARYGDDEQQKRAANSIVKTRTEWHSVIQERNQLNAELEKLKAIDTTE